MFIRKIMLFVVLSMILAACGGEDRDSASQPTAFPTFAFSAPTEAPQVATGAARSMTETAVAAESGALDLAAVERGLGRYEVLECGSCHGAAGEGTDDGMSLLEYEASQDAFVDFMRSGGDLGNDHLYGAERLSNSGIAHLYQYVRSLGQ